MNDPAAQPPKRVALRALLSIGLVLFALALVLVALSRTELGAEALNEVWRRSDPWLLALAIGVISFSQFAVAMRWRALLPGPRSSRGHPVFMAAAICVGLVFNYALPGPVGELASAGMAQRRVGVPFADALAGLLVSRIVGFSSALGVAGLGLLLLDVQLPAEHVAALRAAGVIAGVAAVALLGVALFPRPIRWLVHVIDAPVARLRGWPGRAGAAALRGGQHVTEALLSTSRRGVWAWGECLLWALVGHAVVCTGILLAGASLGLSIPVPAVLFTYGSATAGALVLFLFPGSQFGWDILFATLIGLSAQLGPTDATAMTVVVRSQQVLVVLVGVGVLSLVGGAWFARPGPTKK